MSQETAKLKKDLESVATRMTIMTIPRNALLHGVEKLLEENTAFEDTNDELNEKIYQGDIFEQILSERDLFDEKVDVKTLPKVIQQLEALAELVDTDYVLITNV